MAAFNVQPYYVVAKGKSGGNFWVLGSYPTLERAKQAAQWQLVGAGAVTGCHWYVCTHRMDTGAFYPVDGGKIDFPLDPYPYTREAYAEAMKAHGIDPKHMKGGA